MTKSLHPLVLDAFYCVDAATVDQTLAESKTTHSIELGRGFVIHHGTRDGLPIVIVECQNQKPDELGAIWFDETGGI
jgi:hypothetical protein